MSDERWSCTYCRAVVDAQRIDAWLEHGVPICPSCGVDAMMAGHQSQGSLIHQHVCWFGPLRLVLDELADRGPVVHGISIDTLTSGVVLTVGRDAACEVGICGRVRDDDVVWSVGSMSVSSAGWLRVEGLRGVAPAVWSHLRRARAVAAP